MITVDARTTHVGALLWRAAKIWPERIAVICGAQQITYAALAARAEQVASYLISQGIKPGDHVALWCENSIEFYHALYGIYAVGAVAVPLNTFFDHELDAILKDCSPRIILLSDSRAKKLKAELVPETLRMQIVDIPDTQTNFVPTWDAFDVTALTALMYTSGTTGTPKGVMLSSKALVTNIVQATKALPFSLAEEERILCPLPLFHAFAQMVGVYLAAYVGATVILIDKIDRQKIRTAFTHLPTAVLGVPAFYGLLCLMQNIPLDEVRWCICGGDPLPEKIRMGIELLFGKKLINGYGLTETAPCIAVQLIDEMTEPGTVGACLPGISCEVRPLPGAPKGQPQGLLWVKGDNVMLGYYNAPQATAAVMQDGWLNTGDVVRIDRYKRIVICGRERELISYQGIKIYPQEVEQVLMSDPRVKQAAVIGAIVRDTEVPLAYVAGPPDDPTLVPDLTRLCTERLAQYKVPRAIVVQAELPVSPTGKVDKKRLKKEIV